MATNIQLAGSAGTAAGTTLAGHVSNLAQDRPRRAYKAITARQREVTWAFPGTDCRLILDIDFDDYGNPYLNDALDAARERFPFESVWFEGKPLEDVLTDFIRNTPEGELR